MPEPERTLSRVLELDISRKVQRSLLPTSCPKCQRTEVYAENRMAAEVGGDFYDFMDPGATLRGFLIGDVTGHGVHAALVMSVIYGLFRGSSKQEQRSPGQNLGRLSRTLMELNEGLDGAGIPFSCTAFYGILDESSGVLRYVNAGHPAPLVRRGATGQIEALVSTAPPLGFFAKASVEEKSVVLKANDRLLLFTDGVNEAKNASGEFFGLERVRQAAKTPASSCRAQVQELLRELERFLGGADLSDDVTVVAMHYRGAVAPCGGRWYEYIPGVPSLVAFGSGFRERLRRR